MGLLKLGSIYKKKSKKEVHVPALPSKPEPLSLELNLHNSIDTPVTSPLSSDINNTVPAGSGSLFDDIFAELGTKPTKPKETVMDNDFSLALALSQQLEIDQDNTTRMTGPTKTGNKPSKVEKKANDVKPPAFLLGGDSIYSNYLRGLSALDNTEPSSSSLSTSMFDSILNKSTPTTATSGFISPPVTSPTTPSSHTPVVVLDSDISDSDDSKLSDDSDEESNMQRNRQRMTKGVRPIMERRTQDNRVLVQRKVDNWTNRVDPEQHTAELNESMIERMKDRHRTQVKMAALRNQQQYQDEFNYPPPPQHMVPQPYVPPAMMALPPNGVLQHPGLLMDPVQMYYPAAPLNNNNEENMHQLQQQPIKPSVSVPAAFLPNPTHASLAIPHPPKEEEEDLENQRQQQQQQQQQQQASKAKLQRKSYFGPQPPINPTMSQSNNQSRISGSTTNISSARLSSASSASGKNNSSTATLERIDDEEEEEEEEERLADSPVPMDTPSPVLEERIIFDDAVAAEEADAENSADEDGRASVASVSPRRKKSSRKLRQSQHEVVAETIPPPPAVEESSYTNHTVRASRSTPNFKKGKKKINSRSSSRRNSQDMTGSTPSESVTPPPLPHNSPYISYQSEENLYHVPRSSSQHQLHQQQLQYNQNQQHRQSLRHMKSEPDLPRRSQSANTQQQVHQQKLYQQQQQLNMEWERMQSYQREQLLKQQHQHQHQQQPPFVPMYPMYYNSHGMMDKPYTQPPYTQPPYTQPPFAQPPYTQQQYTQPPYDPYQGPAYNVSSHSKNKPNYYQQSSR
ncbi:hypothetical protein BDF21DRAFT_457322 [Thamnidium elegans]|nr:hypothetical protein BDF21DRAFT_457322 [Thamnidium elegans]